MKRLLAFGLGAFGLRALLRRRRRGGSAPVDELREKLAAHRSAPPEPEPEPASEPEPVVPDEPVPAPEPAAESDSLDARRADVHARARQRIDELSEPS